MTETTKTTDMQERSGWVLYDGECPMCLRSAKRFSRILCSRRFDLAPLQTPWVRERLGLPEGERPKEMIVLTVSGESHRGADAIAFLARHIWWAWPLYVLSRLPGVMRLMRRVYRNIAVQRGRAPAKSSSTTTFVSSATKPETESLSKGE